MTIESMTDASLKYEVTVKNGVAIDCQCKYRHYHKGVQCKHMKQAQTMLNTAVVLPAPRIEDKPVILYSEVCGHMVKHDVTRSCGCDA